METVLIADDEKIIREGLKYIIDWENLGFEICGEAANGDEALSLILSKQPSLVLLDINMPKLQGIDVIKSALKNNYMGKFIILSGYSDFKYAQAAIKYGVTEYLTKPIDEDELTPAIIKAKESIDAEKTSNYRISMYKKKAKEIILHNLITWDDDVLEQDLIDINMSADVYQIILYENYNKTISNFAYSFAELLRVTNQDNNSFEHFKDDHTEVIILKGNFAMQKFQDFLAHYDTRPQKGSPLDTLFLAYGRPVYKTEDIYRSYADAITLLKRRFFCAHGQHTLGYTELPTIEYNTMSISKEKLKEYSQQLTNYIQTFNRNKVAETLYELEHYIYNVKDDISAAKLFLTDLFLQIKENIVLVYNTMQIPFPTNSEIIEYIEKKIYMYEIIQFFAEQFEMIMNAFDNNSRNSILEDVLYYIEHNYKKNLKLETIAPLFGYNNAYLGKIFNKTVGMSFNSYVNHVRIEHSKKLLAQNKLKVYEISEAVGYSNVDYFHKKFRKYVGESPAEYRKNLELE